MPKTHIKRSVNINARVDKVHNILNDFSQWSAWSPWLIYEPEAEVTVSEDNKYYEWEGRRIGSGNMTVLHEVPNKSIDYDLKFLKPWKSTAKVRFEFAENGDSTRVTWLMDSSLPWFMFWMKKMIERLVGMDYERGLNMLKEYTEDGKIKSKLEFIGSQTYEGCDYVGIRTSCNTDQIDDLMEKDFGQLADLASKNKSVDYSKAFSIYHKWDIVKKKVEYTAGIPVANGINTPEGMIKGKIPKMKTYTLRHIGSYLHLGNAWSALYAMQRAKEIKLIKGIHPFETYANNPNETPEEELITDIHVAIS